MNKSDAFDVVNQLSGRRKQFSKIGIQGLLEHPEIAEPLGIFLCGKNRIDLGKSTADDEVIHITLLNSDENPLTEKEKENISDKCKTIITILQTLKSSNLLRAIFCIHTGSPLWLDIENFGEEVPIVGSRRIKADELRCKEANEITEILTEVIQEVLEEICEEFEDEIEPIISDVVHRQNRIIALRKKSKSIRVH